MFLDLEIHTILLMGNKLNTTPMKFFKFFAPSYKQRKLFDDNFFVILNYILSVLVS